MSYHDEPIYEYRGRTCRIISKYFGVDDRQYFTLDIGTVSCDEFFKNGKPLDKSTLHDLVVGSSTSTTHEKLKILNEIDLLVQNFMRESESAADVIKRMVREFHDIGQHDLQCWNCEKKDVSQLAICPTCGKSLRLLPEALFPYSTFDQADPLLSIITVLYKYMMHPGGLKWISTDDLIGRVRWIKRKWLECYRGKRQCWNCDFQFSQDSSAEICHSCGKSLAFILYPLPTLEKNLEKILQNIALRSDVFAVQELEAVFDLEPPYSDSVEPNLYSKQIKFILGRNLTDEEVQKLDRLYEFQWWALNRRD